jgi:hydroxyacylglutathione hydrolase
MALIFEVIKGGGDNLAYVVGCSTERKVAVIDPVASHDILEYCAAKKLGIECILNTHGHPDHTSGNEVIQNRTGAPILAHGADRIVNLAQPLKDGQVLEVGKTKITVIHTPGHTAGSVCFRVQNKFISGDTVFLGGAGNTRFGGNVADLFTTFHDKLLTLPDRVDIYPGHDYAETNLRFARTLEPDNHAIDVKLKELKDGSRNGHFVKSTIGEERKYNPFFRFKNPELIESLTSEYPEIDPKNDCEVFKLIRELRNGW